MLSVIVPATDSPPTLAACLEAIERALPPGGELVVVREPAGDGPAAARNEGARRARGDALAFVDSDVVVEPGALRDLERALASGSVAAIFGAYDDSPVAAGAVSRFRNLLHHHVHSSEPGEATSFWAGLGGVRRDVFEAAGGFDAGRFREPAIEDVELGARLAAAGHRIVLDPAIRGTHLKRWTLRSMVTTDLLRRGVPWVRLRLEGRAPAPGLSTGSRQRLAALATLAAAAATLRRRPRFAALAALAMSAPNASFYVLLARRGGPGLLAAGVVLHALHHLTAVASVPLGVLAHVRAERQRR